MWDRFEWVRVTRRALSPAACEEAIELAERSGFRDGTLANARVGTIVAWVGPQCAVWRRMLDLSAAFAADYEIELDEPFLRPMQVAHYAAGGRYDFHVDIGAGAMSLRKLTAVCELRSAASGGGLDVFGIGALGLSSGDVAVFPSFIPHRVLPVIHGERHSATLWVTGPRPFR